MVPANSQLGAKGRNAMTIDRLAILAFAAMVAVIVLGLGAMFSL
jgi:hypothetical protein